MALCEKNNNISTLRFKYDETKQGDSFWRQTDLNRIQGLLVQESKLNTEEL